ncbi:MAG TPA: ABC transporter permease [Nocardioidaceae bacterium]|nr:ABC transporter permease [Nocardioidaceae bacterium]
MSLAETSEVREPEIIVREAVERPVSTRRRIITGAVLVAVGLLCAVGLGLGSRAGIDATFKLSAAEQYVAVPDLVLPARIVGLVLGFVIVALGSYQAVRGFSRRRLRWVVAVTIVCFVLSFLCWSTTGAAGTSSIDLLGLLSNTIFLAIPLILGALAGVVCERSGVINIAIEGQMIAGAWAGALFASVTHNLYVGVLAALVAGALMGWLLAVFAIRYLVNQVVLGVVLNVFALGLTGFIYDAVMQPNTLTLNSPDVFQPVALPVLSKIPIIGPLLFDQTVIVYATYVLVVVVDVALFRTRWGLRTRAVGEHPKAADTVGIKVRATRYRNVMMGGAVAGLAGAFLTIGAIGAFNKNISSGKGFIALAAVIFGRWSPRGAIAAALLFGFCDALATVLSFTQTPVSIPSNILLMLPYLVTVFAVAGLVGRVQAPAADGQPYVKE